MPQFEPSNLFFTLFKLFFLFIPLYMLFSIHRHKLQIGRKKLKRYVMLEQVEYVTNSGSIGISGSAEFSFIDVDTAQPFMLKRTQFDRVRLKISRPHVYLVAFKGRQILNMKLVYESLDDYKTGLRLKKTEELVDTPKDRFFRLFATSFVMGFIYFTQFFLFGLMGI